LYICRMDYEQKKKKNLVESNQRHS
jgi:hypothetical protein